MKDWSLKKLLEALHDDIQQRLSISRSTLGHTVAKGDASEKIWLQLLQKYLPQRYQAEKAFVVDSNGEFSHQMDVVIFDRQYSPFIFDFEDQKIVPAESVYAVFEAKQTVDAEYVKYTQEKVASVRKLHRTSLPIPHAGGTYPKKEPGRILGGILCLESEWNPPMGKSLEDALNTDKGSLELGCVAAHGYFLYVPQSKSYQVVTEGKPATAFLFQLISLLQFSGTVPMIDIMAYLQWINK